MNSNKIEYCKVRVQIIFTLIIIVIFYGNMFFLQLTPIDNNNFLRSPKASLLQGRIHIIGDGALDNFCMGNGTDGTASNPYVIENYEFDADFNESSFLIENTTKFLIFRNCTFLNAGIVGDRKDSGLKIIGCSNIKVDECYITNNWHYGFTVENSQKINFINNSASNNRNYDLHISDSNNITIIENDFIDSAEVPLCLTNSIFCYISDNNYNYGSLGIEFVNSNHSTITNNSLSNNRNMGIRFLLSSNNVISNNKINHNGWGGISLRASCDKNKIIDNNANYNSHFGIELSKSDKNIVKGNNLLFNNRDGISLIIGSEGNIITQNNVSYNLRYGIEITVDFYNLIYANAFIGNIEGTFECYIRGEGLVWNNNSIGNYWSDYSDRYPNSTNNGIYWNIPYQIGPQSDFLPLVSPDTIHLTITNFTSNATNLHLNSKSVNFFFTGYLGDTPTSFQWDFGDFSANSTEQNPIHTYQFNGEYDVTLTISDSDGDESVLKKVNYISFQNLLPSADFYSNQLNVTINGMIQFFTNGTEGDNPHYYQWDFGDGSINSTLANPTHTFYGVGYYSITLTIMDANGDMSTIRKLNFIQVLEPVEDPGNLIFQIILISTIIASVSLVVTVGYKFKTKKKTRLSKIDPTFDIKEREEITKKLLDLFKISNSIELKLAAKILEMDIPQLLDILPKNHDSMKNIKIDGDYLIISSTEDMDEFVKILDGQFKMWQESAKNNPKK